MFRHTLFGKAENAADMFVGYHRTSLWNGKPSGDLQVLYGSKKFYRSALFGVNKAEVFVHFQIVRGLFVVGWQIVAFDDAQVNKVGIVGVSTQFDNQSHFGFYALRTDCVVF